jgi:hypothetical protein
VSAHEAVKLILDRRQWERCELSDMQRVGCHHCRTGSANLGESRHLLGFDAEDVRDEAA